MELVGIIAFFLFIGALAVAVTFVLDRAAKRETERKRAAAVAEAKAVRWEVVTTSSLGEVMVAVRKNRELLMVAKIPNGVKDWEDRVITAQAEAARRAAVLNAEV